MLTTGKDCKTPKIKDQTSFTSGKIEYYQEYPFYPHNNENCSHLLPCGICDRTNAFCPLHGAARPYEPTWTTSSIGGKKND